MLKIRRWEKLSSFSLNDDCGIMYQSSKRFRLNAVVHCGLLDLCQTKCHFKQNCNDLVLELSPFCGGVTLLSVFHSWYMVCMTNKPLHYSKLPVSCFYPITNFPSSCLLFTVCCKHTRRNSFDVRTCATHRCLYPTLSFFTYLPIS